MRSALGSSAFSSNSAASAGSSRLASKCAGGLAALRVHAQIEWAIVFVGETARRVVHLHGRDSKIRENNVGWFGKNSRKTSKICPVHGKGVRTKSEGAKRASVFGSSIGSTSRPISRPPGWSAERSATA